MPKLEFEALGCLLNNNSIFKDNLFYASYFQDVNLKNLFLMMKEMNDECFEINANSVYKYAIEKHNIEKKTIEVLLKHCLSHYTTSKRAEKVAEALLLKKQGSLFLEQAERIQEMIQDGDFTHDELLQVSAKLNDVVAQSTMKQKAYSERFYDYYQKRLVPKTKGLLGADTGFLNMNNTFRGWQKGKMYVVGGRSNMGKTTVVMNFIFHTLRLVKDADITFFSGETDEDEINDRLIGIYTNLNTKKIEDPTIELKEETERELYSEAADFLYKRNNFNVDKDLSIQHIKEYVHKKTRDYPDKQIIIVIDHAKLIRLKKSTGSEHMDLTEVLNELVKIKMDYNATIILLSQVNRENEKRTWEEKIPELHHLHGSSSLEYSADAVLMVYRPSYYLEVQEHFPEFDNVEPLMVVVKKHRKGPKPRLYFRILLSSNQMTESTKEEYFKSTERLKELVEAEKAKYRQ